MTVPPRRRPSPAQEDTLDMTIPPRRGQSPAWEETEADAVEVSLLPPSGLHPPILQTPSFRPDAYRLEQQQQQPARYDPMAPQLTCESWTTASPQSAPTLPRSFNGTGVVLNSPLAEPFQHDRARSAPSASRNLFGTWSSPVSSPCGTPPSARRSAASPGGDIRAIGSQKSRSSLQAMRPGVNGVPPFSPPNPVVPRLQLNFGCRDDGSAKPTDSDDSVLRNASDSKEKKEKKSRKSDK